MRRRVNPQTVDSAKVGKREARKEARPGRRRYHFPEYGSYCMRRLLRSQVHLTNITRVGGNWRAKRCATGRHFDIF